MTHTYPREKQTHLVEWAGEVRASTGVGGIPFTYKNEVYLRHRRKQTSLFSWGPYLDLECGLSYYYYIPFALE